MRALVVGYGSIGRRHRDVLGELGHDVAVVTRRYMSGKTFFRTIANAVTEWSPDYVVVASATNEHFRDIGQLVDCGYTGELLVEKPLVRLKSDVRRVPPGDVFVGYNLRFHPVIRQMRNWLRKTNVISIQAYAGQYLPDWRPNRDYRHGYSAKKSEGGGVLRDLSHEFDYLMWMLGGWKRLVASGGKLSGLEIDSEDLMTILIEFEKCPAGVVQLNYLDSKLRRELIAVTSQGTVKADLVACSIEYDGDIHHYATSQDQTYIDQHRAILSGARENNCTFEEGLNVVAMIDAIERSTDEGKWVINE